MSKKKKRAVPVVPAAAPAAPPEAATGAETISLKGGTTIALQPGEPLELIAKQPTIWPLDAPPVAEIPGAPDIARWLDDGGPDLDHGSDEGFSDFVQPAERPPVLPPLAGLDGLVGSAGMAATIAFLAASSAMKIPPLIDFDAEPEGRAHPVFGSRQGRHIALYLAANRDAPAASLPIELALRGLGGAMNPSPIDVALWSVFRVTFLTVLELIEQEERRPVEESGPAARGGDGGAYRVNPSPFDAGGGFTKLAD